MTDTVKVLRVTMSAIFFFKTFVLFGKVNDKFCIAVQKLVINLRQKFIWQLTSLLLIVFKKKKIIETKMEAVRNLATSIRQTY